MVTEKQKEAKRQQGHVGYLSGHTGTYGANREVVVFLKKKPHPWDIQQRKDHGFLDIKWNWI